MKIRSFLFLAAFGMAFFWVQVLPTHQLLLSSTKHHQEEITATNIHNKNNGRVLHAVFGDAADAMTRSMQELAAARPFAKDDLLQLEAEMNAVARRILQRMELMDKFDELANTTPEPPSLTIHSASYGPKDGGATDRADVKWLVEPLIFNSLLRLPKGYPVMALFGTRPKGKPIEGPDTLEVEASTETEDHQTLSVQVTNGRLDSDLVVSSARPTQNIPLGKEELAAVLATATKGKKGLEIGGPTNRLFGQVYQDAATTDLINFSEETLWGTFREGSIFKYENGGTGTVHIMDGSTLNGISDNSYDFCIGSHYLEHLINPLKALDTMRRVLRPGGHAILVLPRKEACFDHFRGQSTVEQLILPFLHDVSEDDMRYANVDAWTFGNDLAKDSPAGTLEQFRARSLRFPTNKSIHTHVYDLQLLEGMGKLLSFEVVAKGLTTPLHQWIVLKKKGL